MNTLSAWEWVMLLAGVALVSGALTLIWGPRVHGALSARREANADRTRGVEGSPTEPPVVFGMTVPTRLSVGLVLLLWGYHLAAWSLPSNWLGSAQVPIHMWPWLFGFGVLWAGGSVWMDAREHETDSRGPGEGPDRDPN